MLLCGCCPTPIPLPRILNALCFSPKKRRAFLCPIPPPQQRQGGGGALRRRRFGQGQQLLFFPQQHRLKGADLPPGIAGMLQPPHRSKPASGAVKPVLGGALEMDDHRFVCLALGIDHGGLVRQHPIQFQHLDLLEILGLPRTRTGPPCQQQRAMRLADRAPWDTAAFRTQRSRKRLGLRIGF